MVFSDLLGKHVLVVEDDFLQAIDLTATLEDQGSDVIGPFSDIRDGMTALENASIDVAILDVRLGEGAGFGECLAHGVPSE